MLMNFKQVFGWLETTHTEAAERFETWGGGGGGGGTYHSPSHAHTPTQIFQNAFALFVVTIKPLCNLYSV